MLFVASPMYMKGTTMERIKPQPYDKLLRKALELLTEASTINPEKTGDMRDLEKIWDLELQATMLMESYDMVMGAS